MERLTRAEIQRFTEACPDILRVFETVLGSVFDEQGPRWTDLKLRLGGAMSAVELAAHTRLQARRAMWHCAMVLMSLRDAVGAGHDAGPTVSSLAAIAHTLSLASIACDSEVASDESVRDARAFIAGLAEGPPTWERLMAAHRATLRDGP